MYKDIELKKVRESKMKYRKTYDPAAMKELTESIRSHGVLEPIIVREVTAGDFEIVAGHRRHLAAIEAGLEIVPAIVKELSDEAALEIQVIENSQREDPNPMEEAEGFATLLKMGKHTTETLAEKIGHSVKYVLGRLKLMDLPKKAREMVASGEIGMGHALLLTRLKHVSAQKNMLTIMTQHNGMTIKEAARRIKQTYCLNIKDALFDITNCETCAYRTRNQTVLFPDLKETDECMDKSCYLVKTSVHCKAIIDARKAEGFTVFTTEKEVKKYIEYGAKGSCEIAAPGTKIDEYSTIIKPRRYKSECLKCFDNHAFYMYKDTPIYSDPSIEFGEICLKKSCLDKMNKMASTGASTSKSTTSGEDVYDKQLLQSRAEACRDRWLKASVGSKFKESPVMQTRLAIYILASGNSNARKALVEFCGHAGASIYGDALYSAIAEIDETRLHVMGGLNAALYTAAIACFDHQGGRTMLRMAPEADVVVERDFVIDREWLESQSFKKKSDLVELVQELGIDVETKLSKSKLVDAILDTDLQGKVPKAIAEVCKVDPPVIYCDYCGAPLDECGCVKDTEPVSV